MKILHKTMATVTAVTLLLSLSACTKPASQPPATASGSSVPPTVAASGKYDLTGVSPIKLRLSSALSTNHGCYEGFYQPWMQLVEAESGGLVTFEVYAAGELVEGGKEFDGLREGVIDIAAPLTPIYDSSRFPTSDVTMLPLAFSDSKIGTIAYDMMLESDRVIKDGKTYSQMEFGANGIVYIGHNVPPGSAFNTTGKKINSAADIKGLRIRTGSRTHQIFSNQIGIVPISMPAYDLFDAMSRGAVDGSFIHVADWTAYGFQDLFKYSITDLNFGHFGAGLGMSQQGWDKLPGVVQQIFLDAADQMRLQGAELWDNRTIEITADTQAKGVEFVPFSQLPADAQKAINDAMVTTWAEYIKMQEDAGLPGKEIVKLWHDCVIEAGGKVPEGVGALLQ